MVMSRRDLQTCAVLDSGSRISTNLDPESSQVKALFSIDANESLGEATSTAGFGCKCCAATIVIDMDRQQFVDPYCDSTMPPAPRGHHSQFSFDQLVSIAVIWQGRQLFCSFHQAAVRKFSVKGTCRGTHVVLHSTSASARGRTRGDSGAWKLQAEGGAHVLHALAGDGFNAGGVVKDFDADPSIVLDIAQGLEDGFKLHVAHAGPEQVWVVGVEVAHVLSARADDVGLWRASFCGALTNQHIADHPKQEADNCAHSRAPAVFDFGSGSDILKDDVEYASASEQHDAPKDLRMLTKEEVAY